MTLNIVVLMGNDKIVVDLLFHEHVLHDGVAKAQLANLLALLYVLDLRSYFLFIHACCRRLHLF